MQTKKQSKHDKTGRIALHFVNIWIVKEGKVWSSPNYMYDFVRSHEVIALN